MQRCRDTNYSFMCIYAIGADVKRRENVYEKEANHIHTLCDHSKNFEIIKEKERKQVSMSEKKLLQFKHCYQICHTPFKL